MGMGVLGGLVQLKSSINHGFVESFPPALDSSVERNHANMRRLSVPIKFDGATYGIVGEFRSRHDDSLVRRKITIPVFKMLDSVRSGTMKRAPRSVFFA